MDVQELARKQREAAGGRPRKAVREDAVAACSLCGWTQRSEPRAISDRTDPLHAQQRVWDAAYTHADAGHGVEFPKASDCEEVRERLRVPEPDYYPQNYLKCTARFYVVGAQDLDDEAFREAYHLHWDRCPTTEALHRIAQERDNDTQHVLVRLAPLLPDWRYVP